MRREITRSNGKCKVIAHLTDKEFGEMDRIVHRLVRMGPLALILPDARNEHDKLWRNLERKYHFGQEGQHHVNPLTHEIHDGMMKPEEEEELNHAVEDGRLR